jgi:phosphopantothenoylcysteine decarboxylase/phosphopantothenate--cysteine ligase
MVVMAAAVADYRPAHPAEQKIKKGQSRLVLELERTEDILGAIGRSGARPLVIGFAAETEDVIANAKKKLAEKKADLIVANDVSASDAGFDVETNRVAFVTEAGVEELPLMAKRDVANHLLDAARKVKAKLASLR